MDGAHFNRLEHYLATVATIGTAEALAAATSAVSEPLGFPTLMCGAIRPRGNAVGGLYYCGNWSAQWQQTYVESVLANDPIVQEARRRIMPFTWTELWADGYQVWLDLRALAKSFGWTNGFAVPIHGPGGYVGLVSFAGTCSDVTPTHRVILLALAHAVHQQGRRLYTPATEQKPERLTTRERQAMYWVAHGKTDGEIATILRISASTVHSYIEDAKRKLGVRSRSQAVIELALQDLL